MDNHKTPVFDPTRTAALAALRDFLPKSGRDYTAKRNYDRGDLGHPHVSKLSPYIRHRMITEEEVLQAVLDRYALSTAEKFVQEVYWRTYWKGWLEMRPAVWSDYRAGLNQALNRVKAEGGLRQKWEAACKGETGLTSFDNWAQELAASGYMHNHARMWFASIWIFTLKLPWELGADFFMRHLLDGDPASNTLGWRWVAGLQTKGKTYLARSSNITKFTEGRFGGTHGLATDAPALDGPPHPTRQDPPAEVDWAPHPETGLLITEEDLSPAWLLPPGLTPKGVAGLLATEGRSPLAVSPLVTDFAKSALRDTRDRYGDTFGPHGPLTDDITAIAAWARDTGLAQVVTPYAPVGPTATKLNTLENLLRDDGIDLIRPIRDFDLNAWPYATAGFFKFKEKIPTLVGQIKGLRAA
ncbi:FAD-binding domain-containing protein [Actibacterium sp. 188UL27-1]|uniref:FAD-binding domain-containing protein n=1 Tax=Actibacterium sp. 188UL27-1 TaxID=2786961 RepID=UPI00195CC00B|nr:FAD-binding domain-containing protein [Actibacterium sp. 188UL27-1]MBM7068300.1 DNA photolyase [Actibacterium sp. 188UL27-1]